MNKKNTDTLFAEPSDAISGFKFDESVTQVFPDMIQRSVPGYATIIHMIGQIAERYVQSGSSCYDLGCSLGAATLAMRHRIAAANAQIIAVDNSPAMIEKCRNVLNADAARIPVDLRCEDIADTEINNASMCVLNFTIQFIPIDKRLAIIRKIAAGMRAGGALIISEKIAFEDKRHSDLMVDLHHNFKRANGYSELEIAQKRTALENILIPETAETHKNRILNAGFSRVELWFQCFNFASFIAFK